MTGMDPSYFEAVYRDAEDPWGFTWRWYERRKYALTLAALPKERYRSAFEIGCSIGVLTALLAGRCDRLLSVDVVPAALDAARQRLAGQDHVEFRRWAMGDEWPTGPFDLVVCSEVLYYLRPELVGPEVARAVAALEPGGTLLACHWRHEVADYPTGGDEVHHTLHATPGLAHLGGYQDADLLLDVFIAGPAPTPSVGAADGLC